MQLARCLDIPGLGPDPHMLKPLRSATHWAEARARETLQGYTFATRLCGASPSSPRELARQLAVSPLDVVPRWHGWQLLVADALLGSQRLEVAGCMALHYAAAVGNTELVRKLLSHGACPQSQDDDGRCASHVAALYGQAAVLELLEPLTARKRDRHGRTAEDIVRDKTSPQHPESLSGLSHSPLPAAASGWKLDTSHSEFSQAAVEPLAAYLMRTADSRRAYVDFVEEQRSLASTSPNPARRWTHVWRWWVRRNGNGTCRKPSRCSAPSSSEALPSSKVTVLSVRKSSAGGAARFPAP